MKHKNRPEYSDHTLHKGIIRSEQKGGEARGRKCEEEGKMAKKLRDADIRIANVCVLSFTQVVFSSHVSVCISKIYN